MKLKNYIGGEWVDARRGTRTATVNPADRREETAEYPLSHPEDVDDAIAAAQRAFPEWSAWPAPKRGRVLARAAARVTERIEKLARVLTLDEGKTLEESRAELRRAAEALEFCAGETRRLAGETLPSEVPGRLVMTLREPLGVVGLLTPWNFPAQIAAWKIGPALATGNTVVFKPSSLTPWISQEILSDLVAALEHEGAPKGVVNLVSGTGAVVGPALAAHPKVAAVSFTGSLATGTAVHETLAKRGAPCLAEMGGKNPMVVLDDADIAYSATSCVRGAFGNAGQRCTATSRAIVHERVYSDFVAHLVDRTSRLKVGPGIAEGVDIGPLVSAANLEQVERVVDAAIAAGATRHIGGERSRDPAHQHGSFYLPTVLADVAPDAEIAQEEVFGPVVAVIKAKDDAHALALANGVRYGLSASVYTRDLKRALFFARGFEAGIVHVNSPTVGGETHVPFGGMKATGVGGRERGSAAVDFFTRWKTVYVDSAP
ncbi:MAG TPA: aldehyde dehydrogenase family protein [bacterium]|nr:aldehyde dehydrogenase family protein [bacterium]